MKRILGSFEGQVGYLCLRWLALWSLASLRSRAVRIGSKEVLGVSGKAFAAEKVVLNGCMTVAAA